MPALAFSTGEPQVAATMPEQNLFLAVIATAVQDYRGRATATTNERKNARTAIQKSAEAWLFSPLYEDDFIMVCRLADVEPEFVRRLARRPRQRVKRQGRARENA